MRRDPLDYLASEIQALRDQGTYRRLRVLDDEQKARTSIDHRVVVNLSSNNYLGLTTHPKLRERAVEAIRTRGVGSGSVRTIAGTMDIHMQLERKLAAVQAHRGSGGVSKRFCRKCGDGGGDSWTR